MAGALTVGRTHQAVDRTMKTATRNSATRGISIAALWRSLKRDLLDAYRPELHYMRGPGPAWRAKHGMDAPIRLKPRDL